MSDKQQSERQTQNVSVKKPWYKKWWVIILLIFLALIIIGLFGESEKTKKGFEDGFEQKNTETKKSTVDNQDSVAIDAAKYEIVSSENQSHKALGNKSLSEYTTAEISNLPTDKKMNYNVVISSGIKENQVKPTIDKIISEITSKDSDIDEITLGISSSKELAEGPYDIATATWAPFGKLGNVTPEIAKNNDRSNYKISFELLQDNLEEYLSQRDKSEDKFGLTEKQRRQCYKDLVSAERRASEESMKLYPNDFGQQLDKLDELQKKYKKEVGIKYNITEDQEIEISVEASMENWPME